MYSTIPNNIESRIELNRYIKLMDKLNLLGPL